MSSGMCDSTHAFIHSMIVWCVVGVGSIENCVKV